MADKPDHELSEPRVKSGASDAPTAQDASQHRLVRFVAAVDEAVDKVAGVEPVFLTTTEKQSVLVGLRRVQDRLAGLGLRVLAVADDVAEESGDRDAAVWLAHVTRTERSPNSRDLRLGEALERRWTRLGVALGEGSVNLAQARVVAQALEELPGDLDPGILVEAEEHLIGLAADHRPRELAVLGAKILEVLAPDIAEAEEGRRLEEQERRARESTRLFTRRLGDGSTRIGIKVPDAVADRLMTYLDAFTSPRHGLNDGTTVPGPNHDPDKDPTSAPANPLGTIGMVGVGEGDRIPAARKRGLAFTALLEALDPARLPEHGGDATTVIITLTLDQLRSQLTAAGVITSDQGRISAGEARRLACTAQLVPAVLDGTGQVLDLGRTQRLFSRAQRKALRLRDRSCRAEHCTVPAGWAEAHHWKPWSKGGRTDLADGVLLCSWHHHRAHDDRYQHNRLPNGDIRFTRRT
ncbi:HNH endonuclease signature motif containing protein [Nocardioides terrisoli]|uniref:HNH endonuclease signature motif containing protein n=1 Tax=Nocardioides terrisoli TaxID=3388267 RepID=UPI00287BBD20|nr:DUF222 domain-containing protein [Nocardioides marmorisolisilvae]